MKDTTKQYLAGGIAGAAFAITMFGCAGVANAESGEVAYPNQVQSDSSVTYPNRITPDPNVTYPNRNTDTSEPTYQSPGVSQCPTKNSRAVSRSWERQSDGSYAWVCHYASIYDSPVSTR